MVHISTKCGLPADFASRHSDSIFESANTVAKSPVGGDGWVT